MDTFELYDARNRTEGSLAGFESKEVFLNSAMSLRDLPFRQYRVFRVFF